MSTASPASLLSRGVRPQSSRRAMVMVVVTLALCLLFLAVVSLSDSLVNHQGALSARERRARANQLAAAGVHVALAALRRDASFRERISGYLAGGGYEVLIKPAGQDDDASTPLVDESASLLLLSKGEWGGLVHHLEVLVHVRNPLCEFAVFGCMRPPDAAHDSREPTKGWSALEMALWARPGAPNPDSPGAPNSFAGKGLRRLSDLVPGCVAITGGPVYVDDWFVTRGALIPVGLQCGRHVLVQPGSVSRCGGPDGPGIDSDLDGLCNEPLFTSDAVGIADETATFHPEETLGAMYPGFVAGHPRILDAAHPVGGHLGRPTFDWDWLRTRAQQSGIYIAEDGQVQLGWLGETSPSDRHRTRFPAFPATYYSNSDLYASGTGSSTVRGGQFKVSGTWVDLGVPEGDPRVNDRLRNPFHPDNIPSSGILFSDCALQLQGPVGKKLSIFCSKNAMVCGDLNWPSAGSPVPFALCLGFQSKQAQVPTWRIQSSFGKDHGLEQRYGWLDVSVHKREGWYSTSRGRGPDSSRFLGDDDTVDICGVVVHSTGSFFDGYCPQGNNPASRQVRSIDDRRVICGGHMSGASDNESPANYTRTYGIKIRGAYGMNAGGLNMFGSVNSGKLSIQFDPGLRQHAPPALPRCVNVIRWRSIP